MELALNLVWLGISIAILVLCYTRAGSYPGSRGRSLTAIAAVCVVCLLFPVISMTDDLNSTPALPEANKLKSLVIAGEVVVALLSWVMVQISRENTWSPISEHLDCLLPSQQLPDYSLFHRPPPQLSFS